MSQTELDRLERDVEIARAQVSEDIERLRAPATLSDFKDAATSEARAYRDDFVDKTANAVKDRAQGFLIDIKDRAAANPLAALAIGAGLAWRLLHKPPIATLLIGGGLVGLLKTDPQHPAMGAELVPEARDLAISARDKAKELGAEVSDMFAAGRKKAGEWAENANDTIAHVAVAAEPMTEKLQHWGADAGAAMSEVGIVAKSLVEQGSAAAQRIAQDPEEQDKYLLGVAAVALIAAVGIASQRRFSGHIPSDSLSDDGAFEAANSS